MLYLRKALIMQPLIHQTQTATLIKILNISFVLETGILVKFNLHSSGSHRIDGPNFV